MNIWSELVRTQLGDLTNEAKRRAILALEDLGKEYIVPKVADTVSRAVIKSLDGVVKAAVQSLEMEEDAARLSSAYLVEITGQLDQFGEALEAYLPHALAVETAKKRFGSNSREANDARKLRATWIGEVREEVRDIFRAVGGDEVVD